MGCDIRIAGAAKYAQGVDESVEALQLLAKEVAGLEALPYEELKRRYIQQGARLGAIEFIRRRESVPVQVREVVGASGTEYSVVAQAFWDDRRGEDLRVVVELQSQRPGRSWSDDFIVGREGTVHGRALTVDVSKLAARYIRQRGGRVFVWAPAVGYGLGRLKVSTEAPPTAKDLARLEDKGVEVFIDATISTALIKLRFRPLPRPHITALSTLTAFGDIGLPYGGP